MANYFDKFDESSGNYFDKFDDAPVKLPKAKDAFSAEMKSKLEKMGVLDKFLAGVGKGMTDLAQGAGQMAGVVSDTDVAASRSLNEPLMETTSGKVGSVAGQLAATAPAMLIPAVNTYAGAALLGAGTGALQPTIEGESRALNTGLGAAGGVAGQKIGNMIGGAISKKMADKVALQAKSAPKDQIVKESFDAGYTLPRSLYAPSFKSNLVESFGGKAATLQQASAKNQGVTNDLARKALGVADDTPLSMSTIDTVRKEAYKPYQEIASISKGADNALQELKQARADANAWFNSYNRSANPEHLAKAKEYQDLANTAESVLEDYAKAADKPNLIEQLVKARQTIAKSYTVERAMNKATGDIDARVLGRLYDKNKPLSDGLDTIGKFSAAFPKASQPTQMSNGAGVSALDPVASAIYGAVGSAATGSPTGLMAAGIPLLRQPIRSMYLSKMMQTQPQYISNMLRLSNQAAPALPYAGMYGGGLLGANAN